MQMLGRCSAIRFAYRTSNTASFKSHSLWTRSPQRTWRRYGSSGGSGWSSGAHGPGTNTSSSTATSGLSPLTTLAADLDHIAPRFEVDGATQIEILKGPAQFYDTLKTKILHAERRVFLSTLYIGKTEDELVETIRQALSRNSALKVSILTDALRGTRETPDSSCASLLATLVRDFGSERVQLRMFHTPNLTGVKKQVLPKRINEGWGLQHMKLYAVDDEIIISGANLSGDYFTNRLDRYHLLRSKTITDYYAKIFDAISSMGFEVRYSDEQQGYQIYWPTTNSGPSPLRDPRGYIEHAYRLLSPILSVPSSSQSLNSSTIATTVVYPLFQLAPLLPKNALQQSTELPAIETLLKAFHRPPFYPAIMTFTAGYFNPSARLTSLLLAAAKPLESRDMPSSAPSLTVISASPYANGFYKSPGISGMLPDAYTLMFFRFLKAAQRARLSVAGESSYVNAPPSIQLLEWRRGTVGQPQGWTYHAKGIWATLPPQHVTNGKVVEEAGPSITFVGSSNYTKRSTNLDLEANALIVTRDPVLQRKLKEEVDWLKADASVIGPDEFDKPERKVSLKVRIALWITKLVGGAL